MRTWMSNLKTLTLVVVSCALPATGAEPTMKSLMQSNRQHVLDTYPEYFQSGSQSAEELELMLTGQGATEATAEDWRLALGRVVSLGMREHILGAKTGFVEDDKVLEMTVSALSSEDAETRELAAATLAMKARSEGLLQWKEVILNAIGAKRSEAEILLLGKLDPAPADRDALLLRADVPDEVRARLGDAAAEEKLVQAFRDSAEYHEMVGLARKLGYVGTPAVAQVLVDGLQSEVKSTGGIADRSVRIDILVALGAIHQDEALFTSDAYLLAENSDRTFDRHRGLADYIAAVDAWVSQNYNQPAWGDHVPWFIRYRNEPDAPTR